MSIKKFLPTPRWALRGNVRWAWWCWEPIDHFRRCSTSYVLSDSEWMNEWYEHIHSEDTVKRMSELGINIAVTHFFKGMGKEFEKNEMQRTKELTKHCHNHGIRVIGYTQLGSLYYETFLSENKECKNWTRLDPHGNPMFWCGQYFRLVPCINNIEWINYVKEIIKYGILDIKLDGFHFDNTYGSDCHCPICKNLFKKYLKSKYKTEIREKFGICDFENIEIPNLSSKSVEWREIHQGILQEWILFRAHRLTEVYKELNSYIKTMNRNAVMLGNYSAFCRGAGWCPKNGESLPELFATHDYTFAENENAPGVDANNIVTHQIKAFKLARAGDILVFSTSAVRDKINWKPETIALDLSEAAAFGSIPGSTWALRPNYIEGETFAIDSLELSEILKRYMLFFKKHRELYANAKENPDIAILHCEKSLAFDSFNAWKSRFGMEEILIANHIPYRIIFDQNFTELSNTKLLIISDSKCIPDALCKKVILFVTKGGKLLLTGQSGAFTEHFGQRFNNAFSKMLEHPNVIFLPHSPEKVDMKTSEQRNVPLPLSAGEIINAVRHLYKPSFSIETTNSVAVELTNLPDKRTVLHVINYAAKNQGNVNVKIKFETDIKVLKMLSPDRNEKIFNEVRQINFDVRVYSVLCW